MSWQSMLTLSRSDGTAEELGTWGIATIQLEDAIKALQDTLCVLARGGSGA